MWQSLWLPRGFECLQFNHVHVQSNLLSKHLEEGKHQICTSYQRCLLSLLVHMYTRTHARTHARTHTRTHTHTHTHTELPTLPHVHICTVIRYSTSSMCAGSYETSDPLIQAFSKGVGHSWPTFAEKMGFTKSDLKKPNSTKFSKKWFFGSVWKLPLFERAEGECLLTAALRMAGLDEELMNFTNKLSKGLKIVESRAHTMSQLRRDSEKLTLDTTTTVTESPTDKTGNDTETPTDTGVDTKEGSTLSLPKLEATSGGERVKPSSETTESGRDSGDQRKRPTWGDSSATSYSGSATSYVSDVTSVGDDAYLYGVSSYSYIGPPLRIHVQYLNLLVLSFVCGCLHVVWPRTSL